MIFLLLFFMLFLDVCLCERVHFVFRDLLERINEGQTKPERAVCVVVMFLPYLLVPAGRSCL